MKGGTLTWKWVWKAREGHLLSQCSPCWLDKCESIQQGLTHLQVVALWERADEGAQISASISECNYCGGNGVGHGRARNRQSLPRPPNPFVSTAPSQWQQHSACLGCTTDWNHIEIRRKKRKIEQGWHQMLYCQYTKAVLHLFGWS